MEDSEKLLREMLWLRHGCSSRVLYGDDGKMFCNSCMIDFVNDSPEKIQARFWVLAQQRAEQFINPVDPDALLANLKKNIISRSQAEAEQKAPGVPNSMTMERFQGIVLRLSNQMLLRWYAWLNYPNDPQIFGLQCHSISEASGFGKQLRAELERLGFVWNQAHELWTIERTEGGK